MPAKLRVATQRLSTPLKALQVAILSLLCIASIAEAAGSIKPAAGSLPGSGIHVFEVSDFGASPDATRDSSQVIQRAVDAASRSTGAVVHFPCGDWRADAVLNSAPAQRSALYFSGLRNITFRGDGKCSRIFTTIAARSVFEIQTSTNVSFENLRIEPAPAAFEEHYQNDGGSAIRLAGVDGGFIRNVEMSGGSAALLWLNAGTANYTVAHNYIHHGFGNSAIWEDDCSAGDSTQDCGASLPPHGNVIEDNLIVDNGITGGVAQLVLDSGGHVTNTIVRGNTIRGRPEPRNPHIHGIQVGNAGGALVQRNRIVDVLDDGIAVTASNGILITGTRMIENTIEGGCADAAIIVYAALQGRVEQTLVRGNHIHSTAGRGIVLAGTMAKNLVATKIAGNEIAYATGNASAIDALSLRAKGMNLSGNAISTADPQRQVWIRVDPDSSDVHGIASTRRMGPGRISIFDPARISDAIRLQEK
jgi:Right handed beta helix region/Pectate lyase superfamily protein